MTLLCDHAGGGVHQIWRFTGALLETVILLFYFFLIFGTLAGWDAFITAMLSDRSSAEDVCRVGGEKKSLVKKPLQHIRLLSSHIHARSGALMLPLSASDPTSRGRPQTATIWCGLFFFGRGDVFKHLSAASHTSTEL